MKRHLQARLVPYQEIWRLVRENHWITFSLIISSLLAALTEGLGISLVIPLLETGGSEGQLLRDIPLLGTFAQLIANAPLADRVRFVAISLAVIALLRGGFIFASDLLAYLLQIRVERDLKGRVVQQLLAVDLHFIHQQRGGNLMTIFSIFTTQVGSIIQVLGSSLLQGFILVAYTALLLMVSWQLTLLAVVLMGLASGLIRTKLSTRVRSAGKAFNQAAVALNIVGLESIQGMKVIRLFNRGNAIYQKFQIALKNYQEKMYRRSQLLSLTGPVFSTLNAFVLAILLILSSFLLPANASEWVGMLLVFLIIMYRLMAPAAALNKARNQVASLYPALQNVLTFLERKDKPFLTDGTIPFERMKEGIQLKNVTFHYEAQEPPVLKDVSFSILKGKMTAVVGPSGSGKTTVVNLLTRLYDPQKGIVLVDGINLSNLRLSMWRSNIAVVSQDTFIFNDTVTGNLKFAKEDATEGEIQQATMHAKAHDFLKALPAGYNTLLGDRGVRLSGGQQQRLAIARAFLADPQLLILDEATSSLDSETERAIQEAIDNLIKKRTVLAIAHRLSTVRNADNIIVLVEGQVAEQGSHQELMKAKGHYWQMVQTQQLQPELLGS